MQRLVRDLNQLYRQQPALHRLDCDAAGFEWLVADDAEQSVLAWRRRDDTGREAIVVCNFTPVPRPGYRLGLPEGAASAWRVALDTDATDYGGTGAGDPGSLLHAEPTPARGRTRTLCVDLPPLATLFLLPA
jgi:1,4-alpha-glucan branching enzyme